MPRIRRAAFIAGLFALVPPPALAQQFVVDDAGITEFRACQLEAWHGERTSWILPACQPVRNLELTAGLGRIAPNEGGRETEYVVQGKYQLRPDEPDAVGVSVVAGAGLAPIRQPGGRRVTDFFLYVPVTASLAGDRLILHPNLGWLAERENANGDRRTDHQLTWGLRGDLLVAGPVQTIAEIWGEDLDGTGWQVGLRTEVVPDRFFLDVSYGDHFESGDPGPGFTIGFAWTPPPFR